jgi:glycosyltransferase involved in cell wall biosynthesis
MTQRRKLLFYTHGLVSGGAERVFARLASGFRGRGDEVIFAVDFEAEEDLGLLSQGVEQVVLPPGHAQATMALAGLLKRSRPDASLSALSVSNLKHAAAAALAGRRTRAVMTYHGFYESEPEPLSNLGYRLTPLLTRGVGRTVTVSEALRQSLVRRFRAPAGRVVTIYNPAAPEPLPPEPSAASLAARAPIVLSMGRLVPDKDFVTLLRAFARVKDHSARLRILGEGPERERLQAEIRALGLESRIDLPGYIRDTASELAQAKCCVISSRRESFGLSCVEALAHGLPVATTDCGGPVEILGPLRADEPIPIGDASALATAIEAALADSGDPTPRRRRAEQFSLDAALEAYDRMIDDVIRRA